MKSKIISESCVGKSTRIIGLQTFGNIAMGYGGCCGGKGDSILLTRPSPLHQRQQVATLQCHVCENCALDEDLSQEMQMCGDSGDFGQMMTQSPSSKTTAAATTTGQFSTKISESDEYEEYSYEETEGEEHEVEQETEKEADEKRDRNRTTTITTPPTTMETTAAPSTINASSPLATSTPTLTKTLPETTIATKPDKDEYEDDAPKEYVESRRMSVNASQYVCYVIHLNVNNTVITNRGCATLRGNKYLTCQTLSKGLSIENCQVCSSDGCNANSYEAWFSAAPAATRFSHRMLRSVSVMLLSYMAMLLR